MSAPYDEAKATSATARPLQLIRNARSLVSPSGTRFWCVVEQNLEMNFRVTETIENGTIPRIDFPLYLRKFSQSISRLLDFRVAVFLTNSIEQIGHVAKTKSKVHSSGSPRIQL
jgi:hypothetical protein